MPSLELNELSGDPRPFGRVVAALPVKLRKPLADRDNLARLCGYHADLVGVDLASALERSEQTALFGRNAVENFQRLFGEGDVSLKDLHGSAHINALKTAAGFFDLFYLHQRAVLQMLEQAFSVLAKGDYPDGFHFYFCQIASPHF